MNKSDKSDKSVYKIVIIRYEQQLKVYLIKTRPTD